MLSECNQAQHSIANTVTFFEPIYCICPYTNKVIFKKEVMSHYMLNKWVAVSLSLCVQIYDNRYQTWQNNICRCPWTHILHILCSCATKLYSYKSIYVTTYMSIRTYMLTYMLTYMSYTTHTCSYVLHMHTYKLFRTSYFSGGCSDLDEIWQPDAE